MGSEASSIPVHCSVANHKEQKHMFPWRNLYNRQGAWHGWVQGERNARIKYLTSTHGLIHLCSDVKRNVHACIAHFIRVQNLWDGTYHAGRTRSKHLLHLQVDEKGSRTLPRPFPTQPTLLSVTALFTSAMVMLLSLTVCVPLEMEESHCNTEWGLWHKATQRPPNSY